MFRAFYVFAYTYKEECCGLYVHMSIGFRNIGQLALIAAVN